MAGNDSTTKNPEILYLDPQTYSRLDTITRAKVGRPISVQAPEEMKNDFACAGSWLVSVCVNPEDEPEERFYREKCPIYLVNQVDLERFRSVPRPEMDWSAIPPHMVFDFLVWHEIAHLTKGHLGVVGFNENRAPWDPTDPRDRFLARASMEREADRYAWGVLFPGTSLPVKKNQEYNLQELDKFSRKYKRFFAAPELTFDPLPSTPGRFVLESHLKHGIPWAEPVARRLNLFQAIGDGLASLATALNLTGGRGCRSIIDIDATVINQAPGTDHAYPLVHG